MGVADGIWGGKWAMGGVYLIAFARQTAGKIKRRNGILWSGEETSNWGHRENGEMVTKAYRVEWSGGATDDRVDNLCHGGRRWAMGSL